MRMISRGKWSCNWPNQKNRVIPDLDVPMAENQWQRYADSTVGKKKKVCYLSRGQKLVLSHPSELCIERTKDCKGVCCHSLK